jgi:predicted dehydrogenase
VTTRFAFIGFRHPHIYDMHQRCTERDDIEIVACCEQDAATRETLASEGTVTLTHENYADMLAEVECDVVAVGDYYSARAGLVLQALETGRHVIVDKPLCTSLEDLDKIEKLARDKGLIVSGMFDMRDGASYLGMRDVVQSGELGRIHAIGFEGQHPLRYGVRPMWYFEQGKHGGTLNDIAIHALDMIPWMTGQPFATVVAARCWHATPPEQPNFKGCGQAMLTLADGAGVICDVSYLSPDSFVFDTHVYWRFNIWGEDGMLEGSSKAKVLTLYKNGETIPRELPLPEGKPGGYLDSLLAEISGQTDGLHLPLADVLRATRVGLITQQAADKGLSNVTIG